MKKKYLPTTCDGRIFHLVEECAEVLKIIGKAGRFGMASDNAGQLPKNNAQMLQEELQDLKYAIAAVEKDLPMYIP